MTQEMIRVEVAYAKPEVQRLLEFDVPAGTTIREALRISGIAEEFEEIDVETATIGIFGKVVSDESYVLRELDRVEIYRPLINDPREQRAERAKSQKESAKDT